MAFLGIGFGQVVAVCCQPFFNKYVSKTSVTYLYQNDFR